MKNILDTSPSLKSDASAPQQAIHIIQGKICHSSYEYNIATALQQIGMQFYYQYEIQGGFRKRGGMVLDFLVLTRPLYTPVEVNGDWFHRDANKEFQQEADINSLLKSFCFPLVIFWGKDSITPEDALSAVRKRFK